MKTDFVLAVTPMKLILIATNAQKICSRYFASTQDNKGKIMESKFDVSFRFLAWLLNY